MNDRDRIRNIELIDRLLKRDDARLSLARPPIPIAPEVDKDGNLWACYEGSKTLYVVIAVGPEEPEREREIRHVLGIHSI